jgi:hypothetical protein
MKTSKFTTLILTLAITMTSCTMYTVTNIETPRPLPIQVASVSNGLPLSPAIRRDAGIPDAPVRLIKAEHICLFNSFGGFFLIGPRGELIPLPVAQGKNILSVITDLLLDFTIFGTGYEAADKIARGAAKASKVEVTYPKDPGTGQ